jgi:adenylosuccinate lyase
MTRSDRYESPLGTRYASPVMQRLWSPRHRAGLWRRLWLALAETQQRLGIDIPDEALEQMRAHLDTVDLEAVARYEKRFRHDVMAHVHHFGDQAPAARPFLHLGATSAFVTDNADLILLRDALHLLLSRIVAVLRSLGEFAEERRAQPTVAFTHFQPAQLTTVGKRATLWAHDLCLDAEAIRDTAAWLPFRGCKGTTGTQASYLELFDNDHAKVRELDRRVAAAFDFANIEPVTGQTYTRKIDSRVLDALAGLAQSASKLATDLRLLQHEGEILEPFEREQIGSSAMAYKRNPMRAERICSLARYLITLRENTAHTVATQWFERTLDDSANRRMVLPDGFLSADAILILLTNVCAGLEVRDPVVRRNVNRVMPFMATERWLMLGVQAGGDRQALHEVIRQASHEVSEQVAQGGDNDLLDRLAADPAFAAVNRDALKAELDPDRYVGRSPQQVDDFLSEVLHPLIESMNQYRVPDDAEITV